MTDLTAIDVLIDPDEQAIERARVINARLLKSLPQGWALDDTHKPHITTLQRYVRTADLDKVYDAVEETLGETDMASLGYQPSKSPTPTGASRATDPPCSWCRSAPR